MEIHNELAARKSIAKHTQLNGVDIPDSSENELILPCRLSLYGFILLNENKNYVNDIPTARINETLSKMNKNIDLILIEKKLEESKDYQEDKILALRILFIFGIITAFVMYMLVLYEVKDFKSTYIFIPIVILILIVFISLLIMIKGLMTERVKINIDKQVVELLDKIIKVENEMYYNSKGFLLSKNENFYWLSLKKVF